MERLDTPSSTGLSMYAASPSPSGAAPSSAASLRPTSAPRLGARSFYSATPKRSSDDRKQFKASDSFGVVKRLFDTVYAPMPPSTATCEDTPCPLPKLHDPLHGYSSSSSPCDLNRQNQSSPLPKTPAHGKLRRASMLSPPDASDQPASPGPAGTRIMGLISKRPCASVKSSHAKRSRQCHSSKAGMSSPSHPMQKQRRRQPAPCTNDIACSISDDDDSDVDGIFRRRGNGRDSAGNLGVSPLLGSFYGAATS